eukprot:jgi/Hompol1/2136/HPOL_002081-RA
MPASTLLISFLFFAAATTAGYIYMPKGPDILWAITYMAQLHPLIQPERTFGHLPTTSPGGGGGGGH